VLLKCVCTTLVLPQEKIDLPITAGTFRYLQTERTILGMIKQGTMEKVVPAANPEAASLHYKTSFAIGLFVQGLLQRMPGVKDNPGRPITFASHQFEIIASDVTNKATHEVALIYTTGTLTLFRTTGDYLLLADGDLLNNAQQQLVSIYLLKLQPDMSISEYVL